MSLYAIPVLHVCSIFVRSRNLPYSIDDVRKTISSCQSCAEIKPNFFKPPHVPLIKATQPFERLSIDFKGPLPSVSSNRYLFTVVDEYSRFPFAFACQDTSTSTVIKCLTQIFTLFGMPFCIHSDRGASFMFEEFRNFLHSKGINPSRTTPYNPQGNGQVERTNGTIWRTISLSLLIREDSTFVTGRLSSQTLYTRSDHYYVLPPMKRHMNAYFDLIARQLRESPYLHG